MEIINNTDFYIELDLHNAEGISFRAQDVQGLYVEIFTTNINRTIIINSIIKEESKDKIFVDSQKLKALDSGVIAYVYNYYTLDSNASDKQFNRSEIVYTDYYYRDILQNGKGNRKFVVYTKEEANDRFQIKGNYLTEHQDISGLATKKELPTKLSQLANDSKYITATDIANKANKNEIPKNISQLNNDAGYLTTLPTNITSKGFPIVTTITNKTLEANTFYNLGEQSNITVVKLKESTTPNYSAEYILQFASGSTPTVLSLPDAIKWQQPLIIKANCIYQISIVNNLATYGEWK